MSVPGPAAPSVETERVDDHQDLPSDGHDAEAMAITESDRIRWSPRRRSAPNADSALPADGEFAAIERHRTASYALSARHAID